MINFIICLILNLNIMGFWSDVLDVVTNVYDGASEFISDATAGIPVIGGFTGAIDELVFGDDALAEQKRQESFSAQQAYLNRQFQEYMWNKSNVYNDPSAQLQRLQNAGISPNAFVGSSGGFQVATASPTPGATASSPSAGLASAMLTNDAVNSNLRAQAQKTQSETDLNKYQLGWNMLTESQRYEFLERQNKNFDFEWSNKDADTLWKHTDVKVKQDLAKWYCSKTDVEIVEIKEHTNLLRNQLLTEVSRRLNVNADTANKILQQEVIRRQSQLIAQQTKTEENRTELLGQQYDTEVENTELTKAKIDNTIANTNLQGQQEIYVAEQTEGQHIDNIIRGYEVQFSEATGLPYGIDSYNTSLYMWLDGTFPEYLGSMLNTFNHGFMSSPGSSLFGIGALSRGIFGSSGSYRAVRPTMHYNLRP